jgi:hypothetical protein
MVPRPAAKAFSESLIKMDSKEFLGAWLKWHLPSKHEALSSNPVPPKQKKKTRR